MRSFLHENIHASSRRKFNWNSINWKRVERKVKELQIRIAKAVLQDIRVISHTNWPFEVLEPVRRETCLHGS